MATIREVSAASHTHTYHISLKEATWATALIILVMTLLFPILQFPPKFGTASSDNYFHSIGLSMVALVTCLTLLFFDIPRHEPVIDFPLHYRALLTSILAALSGIFYLTPALSSIPQIPTILFVLAVLFTIDITGALFIELLFLPRKLAGSYATERVSHLRFPYRYLKMFAYSKDDFRSYSKTNAAYWLVLAGDGCLFVGEIMGLVLLWLTIFGTSFLGFYVGSLGGLQSTLGSILDPHSHGVAVSLMAMVIGLAVQRFGVLERKGWKMQLTRIGIWISILSIIALTLVYVAGAAVNYSPPTLFSSGPNGINGMAGDDALITLVFIGGLLALLPMALTQFHGKRSWHDTIRCALLFTLFMWVFANSLAGFLIEFNETSFQNALLSNDEAFAQFQPMFGIFFLTIAAMVLLAADYYGTGSTERRNIGVSAGVGVLIAAAGGLAWVFIDPSTSGYYFWAYIFGILLVCASILLSVVAIYRAKTTGIKVMK
ncbi:MAG: hypothetical protein KGH57_03800 [Candidatus Micrarchaeota archaeon]|nr:hypothetical protein [Candidatus Micrarchaeota archaeon]